eukprot:gene39101-52835_t
MSVERTLHHFPLDPVSRQVRLVLGEKRLPFVENSVRYWERPRALTKMNPSGMIPILVETTEGQPPLVLCEGRAILDHLEETYPEPSMFAADLAERAEARVLEYEKLVQDTVSEDQQIEKDRSLMDAAAKEFMKVCYDYLTDQEKSLAGEITAGAAAAKITERTLKLKLANDVVDAGNGARLIAWRAQAERNPARVAEAKAFFATIKTALDTMRPLTVLKSNLDQIDACQKAADQYQSALQNLAENWTQKDALAVKRAEVANAVLAEARNTAALGLADTTKITEQAAGSLGRAGIVLTWGLVGAAVL